MQVVNTNGSGFGVIMIDVAVDVEVWLSELEVDILSSSVFADGAICGTVAYLDVVVRAACAMPGAIAVAMAGAMAGAMVV